MVSPQSSGIGAVVSADIAVPEHERELRFYSSVLTTGDSPLWRDDLLNSRGIPIIGLGARDPTLEDLPLQWMPHIQVADVGASAERALARGARALMRHDEDQWAVLADPDGAAFGIVPVLSPEAMPPLEGGRIAWLDLTVPHATETRDFYQDVVGWSAEAVPMEDAAGPYADYNLCAPDGAALAGVCHARGVNADLPPVWLIYLPVGDLEESLSRARREGGEVVHAGKGSAVIRDPVGAYVALVPG